MIDMKRIKRIITGIIVVASGVMLLFDRENAVNGVKQGISTCFDVLIPSLFPIMILSAFAVKADILSVKSRFFRKAFRFASGLSAECIPAVIFGFLCGYPVGANVTAELYLSGRIDSLSAKSLLSSCVNAGPAFVITAVGALMLGSRDAGLLLFLCCCLSSVISGIIFRFFIGRPEKRKCKEFVLPRLSDCFVDAVAVSSEKMIGMCAWVILFSAVTGVVSVHAQGALLSLWSVVAEVTSGVPYAVSAGGLPYAAFCISFGGLCVMCQLLPSIKKCGVSIPMYLTFRIVNGLISFFVMKLLLLIFPVTVDVFAAYEAGLAGQTASVSAVLIITAVVFVFDISAGAKKGRAFSDLF